MKSNTLNLFDAKVYFLLLIVLSFLKCTKRFNCSKSNNLKLGTIDYTAEFKQCEYEGSTKTMKFSSPNGLHILERKEEVNKGKKWLKEYLYFERDKKVICKSFFPVQRVYR